MAHPSPENHATIVGRIAPIGGSIGLGLGLGLAATGEILPGSAVALVSLIVLVARALRPRPAAVPVAEPEHTAELVDPETGLPNSAQLHDLLRREIARSLRYGDRAALAIFDVRITGYHPAPGVPAPPSPAQYVASTMLEAARTSDIVARIDTTHFAVVLTECTDDGAVHFGDRLRTRLGTMPFAHTEDGKGIYVRAWSGVAHWNTAIETPGEFTELALQNLETTRRGYESAQAGFRAQKTAS